jgi:hypothetical protein
MRKMWASKRALIFSSFSLLPAAGSLLPYFPAKVNNVSVTVGQNAELKCQVENLNNYKVGKLEIRKLSPQADGSGKNVNEGCENALKYFSAHNCKII